MNVEERRNKILELLCGSQKPITAKELAAMFNVSRQVIVQDMAVIRASTQGIISTHRGYTLQKSSVFSREFKVRHSQDETEHEFQIIVDCGGRVKNESISHKIYGRITAEIDIGSRQDVREFIEAMSGGKSKILGNATSGYHYHLVEASSEERLDLIADELWKAGILTTLQPWERKQDKDKEKK